MIYPGGCINPLFTPPGLCAARQITQVRFAVDLNRALPAMRKRLGGLYGEQKQNSTK